MTFQIDPYEKMRKPNQNRYINNYYYKHVEKRKCTVPIYTVYCI